MRILIADQRKAVRSALRLALEVRCPRWTFAEAASFSGLLQCVRGACPDLVILDWDLRDSLELATHLEARRETIRQLRLACPSARVVISGSTPEIRPDALLAGADAFVCKADPPETLELAIQSLFESDL